MSISSTRKVSGSPSAAKKTEYANRGGHGSQFVEVIDTANSISVNNRSDNDQKQQQNNPQRQDEEKSQKDLAAASNYIPNALEALAASGVYDDAENNVSSGRKIGVYDNNQSIIHGDQQEKISHSYLKHFYERNEIIEEVDELV